MEITQDVRHLTEYLIIQLEDKPDVSQRKQPQHCGGQFSATKALEAVSLFI